MMKNLLSVLLIFSMSVVTDETKDIAYIYSYDNTNQIVMNIEAALARAQASQGIIPEWAAEEITKKAEVRYMPKTEVDAENEFVRHRLVSRLNVWKRSLDNGAEEYLHYGATTVDIFDTVLVLQIKASLGILIDDLIEIENLLLKLTKDNIETYMAGRTIGQHALPITFGKKTSTWLAENRRNIERLKAVEEKINRSVILKGAVGTYLGLGPKGIETELLMSQELGLGTPYIADWHGVRDVFAEYALTLALISKSFGRIGDELTLLQMTEIGETLENLGFKAIGSSTMPHKKNPRGPGNLVNFSRIIPRQSEIILDDMVNSFERDQPRSDETLKDISITAELMTNTAIRLLNELEVNKDVMRKNLNITNGLILSQRVTYFLADIIGKDTAESMIHDIAMKAIAENISLSDAIKNDKIASQYFTDQDLKNLLDPETYIGLAIEQVEIIINQIESNKLD
jgi:adenylosuccinate lyase|tara:strand:+ start:1820 stop:3190 length:1371 start_codon:yes stop_codon:yes gene_type:complete